MNYDLNNGHNNDCYERGFETGRDVLGTPKKPKRLVWRASFIVLIISLIAFFAFYAYGAMSEYEYSSFSIYSIQKDYFDGVERLSMPSSSLARIDTYDQLQFLAAKGDASFNLSFEKYGERFFKNNSLVVVFSKSYTFPYVWVLDHITNVDGVIEIHMKLVDYSEPGGAYPAVDRTTCYLFEIPDTDIENCKDIKVIFPE